MCGLIAFEFRLTGRLGLPETQEPFIVQFRLPFGDFRGVQRDPGAFHFGGLDLDLVFTDGHLIFQNLPVDSEEDITFFPGIALIDLQQLQRPADFRGDRRIFHGPDRSLNRDLLTENPFLQRFNRHTDFPFPRFFRLFLCASAADHQSGHQCTKPYV